MADPPELRLHFYGPFTLCSQTQDVLADCPHRTQPGIYVWSVQQSSGLYRVSYIGETTVSFYARNRDHVVQTLGGNYRILDPDRMASGIHHISWNGLWRKGTRDRLPEFVRRYEEFAPVVRRFLIAQRVFVASLTADVLLRRTIEGAIARYLRSQRHAGSLLPSDFRYFRASGNRLMQRVLVSADEKIEGLPDVLEI